MQIFLLSCWFFGLLCFFGLLLFILFFVVVVVVVVFILSFWGWGVGGGGGEGVGHADLKCSLQLLCESRFQSIAGWYLKEEAWDQSEQHSFWTRPCLTCRDGHWMGHVELFTRSFGLVVLNLSQRVLVWSC